MNQSNSDPKLAKLIANFLINDLKGMLTKRGLTFANCPVDPKVIRCLGQFVLDGHMTKGQMRDLVKGWLDNPAEPRNPPTMNQVNIFDSTYTGRIFAVSHHLELDGWLDLGYYPTFDEALAAAEHARTNPDPTIPNPRIHVREIADVPGFINAAILEKETPLEP